MGFWWRCQIVRWLLGVPRDVDGVVYAAVVSSKRSDVRIGYCLPSSPMAAWFRGDAGVASVPIRKL
jgi:hypothetical protein